MRDIEKLSAARLPKSGEILERARKVLLSPQVTGPFRAPSSVAFVKEARGSKIIDFDGNEYVDVTMAYGPLILGHSHPVVVEAVERAVRNGTVYAIAHEREVHAFCEEQGIAFRLIGIGSWFLPHFVQREPANPRDLRGLDNLMRGELLGNYMRYHGVYMPDLHTVFMSAAHTDEDADRIVLAFETSLLEMRQDGLL